jgi:hypothetical protein
LTKPSLVVFPRERPRNTLVHLKLQVTMDGNVERKQPNMQPKSSFPGERPEEASNYTYLNLLLRWSMDGNVEWKQLDKPFLVAFPGGALRIDFQLHLHFGRPIDGNLESKQPNMQPNPSRPSSFPGSALRIQIQI